MLRFLQVVLRISAVPPFSGLRRFPEGRDFHQWTGDDSKALMKVSYPFFILRFLYFISELLMNRYI